MDRMITNNARRAKFDHFITCTCSSIQAMLFDLSCFSIVFYKLLRHEIINGLPDA